MCWNDDNPEKTKLVERVRQALAEHRPRATVEQRQQRYTDALELVDALEAVGLVTIDPRIGHPIVATRPIAAGDVDRCPNCGSVDPTTHGCQICVGNGAKAAPLRPPGEVIGGVMLGARGQESQWLIGRTDADRILRALRGAGYAIVRRQDIKAVGWKSIEIT